MKHSWLYILMANLWIMLAWLVEGTFVKLSCVLVGMIWLFGFIFFSHKELEIDNLQFKLDRLKKHTEELKYEKIVKLLETIAGKEKPKKRK